MVLLADTTQHHIVNFSKRIFESTGGFLFLTIARVILYKAVAITILTV